MTIGCHHHHRARFLGIILLILSLVHAPWPQADFHNVHHQDEPGQVCEHHDHLLRWHPDAGQAEDVAILHWHWFLPSTNPDDRDHLGSGPLIHAHVDGWDVTSPDSGSVVVPDRSSRPLETLTSGLLLTGLADQFARPGDHRGPRSEPGQVHAFGATFAQGASLAAWLQRWSC